jgi:hypothetical protein
MATDGWLTGGRSLGTNFAFCPREGILKSVDPFRVVLRASDLGSIECFDRCVGQHSLVQDCGESRGLVDLELAARRPGHEKALLHASRAVDLKQIEHQRAGFRLLFFREVKGHTVNILNDGIVFPL